jgi:hypothetical protein
MKNYIFESNSFCGENHLSFKSTHVSISRLIFLSWHKIVKIVAVYLFISLGLIFSYAVLPAAAQERSSIWDASTTPTVPAENVGVAAEIGVKFRSEADGYITGLRFYKGLANTGTHVGNLWTRTGTLLATATFTNETASGWQEVLFSSPVPISAETTYLASYHSASGYIAFDDAYLTVGVDNYPLRALADGEDGPNGVYRTGASGFPSMSWNSSNYWVDVVFEME